MASSIAASWSQLLYRTNLVYNQCWEDPARDHEALDLGPDDRVLAITSAGCNVLEYALRGARVLAVDANPRQNHLLELKLAGIRTLAFDDFFALFGDGGTPRAREIYASLRHLLTPAAQAFWDSAIRLFDPSASWSPRAPAGWWRTCAAASTTWCAWPCCARTTSGASTSAGATRARAAPST